MKSTLSEYMAFDNNIESVGVKVMATEPTDLEFSVFLPDVKDDQGNELKIYGSTIHMSKTDDYKWVQLPINLYLDSKNVIVKLMNNPKIIVSEETMNDCALAMA